MNSIILFMLLSSLIIIPIIGIFIISLFDKDNTNTEYSNTYYNTRIKSIALITSLLNLIVSFVIFILFNFSNNNFQIVHEHYNIQLYDIYFGIDGISIYFVLLTTIIMPIALVSN